MAPPAPGFGEPGGPPPGPPPGSFPAGPPTGGSKNRTAIVLGVVAALVIAVIAVVALAGGDDDDDRVSIEDSSDEGDRDEDKSDDESSDTTEADSGDSESGLLEGDAYGDNPVLDALWDDCEAGDMQACDDLYLQSPFGSEYEAFGDSCGERNEPAGYCVDLYDS